MLILSREQTLAKITDRHIAINANAGSGKTTVLVERYLDIIKNNEDNNLINKIVAITFTRKAAAEMKSKIIHRLNELIESPSENRYILENYKKIREKILYARIMTIHSFCSSLLKDYPVEADLAPNFGEITPFDKSTIVENAILNVIESYKNSDDENLQNRINTILSAIDIKKLTEELLPRMINDSEKIEQIAQKYDKSEIIDVINSHFKDYVWTNFKQIFKQIEGYLEIAEVPDKNTDRVENCKILLKEAKASTDILYIYQKIFDISQTKFIKNSMVKGLANKNGFDYLSEFETLKELNSENWFSDEEILLHSINVGKELIALYRDIQNEIAKEKKELNVIDFNDMIQMTNKLLDNKNVIDDLRREIDYLMVDEFQDTNQLQYGLIEKIVKGFNNDNFTLGSDSINLFIVGDYKQSIYGFRSANVNIFKGAIEKIKLINQKGIDLRLINKFENLTEDEQNGFIKFNASHRMMPNLAAFINIIFDGYMKKENFDDNKDSFISYYGEREVEYDELISNKRASEAIEQLEKNNLLDDDFGNITFISTVEQKEAKASEDSEEAEVSSTIKLTEPEAIANYILDAINSQSLKIKGRPVNFSDFTILSRRAGNFGQLAAEFTKRKIPFIINSGKGYFQKPEIRDFAAMLNFLIDKTNDLAFLTVFRGVFFQISDEEIFKISKVKASSFYEKYLKYVEDNSSDKLLRVREIIEALDKMTYVTPISELIYKISEYTGWFGVIQNYYDSAQRKVNFEKFINYAREYEKRGYKNIIDFVNELNTFADDSDESEASVSGDGNAVQLMTIHKSKGLGFNIVVLYDISSKGGNHTPSFYFDEKYGISFKMKSLEDIRKPKKNKQTYLADLVHKKAEDDETKRVVYVALTRAKEHIAVSIQSDYQFNINNISKLIANQIGLEKDSFWTDAKINLNSKLKFLANNKVQEREINFKVNIVRPENLINIEPVILVANSEDKPLLLLDNIEAEITGETFSATKILAFRNNTHEYVEKYVLGLFHSFETSKSDVAGSTDKNELTGKSWGTIVHLVMEFIDLWIDEKGNINISALKKTVVDEIARNEIETDDNSVNSLIEEIVTLANTDYIKNHLPNILESERELTLMYPFENEMLVATIDMLYKNRAGEYEVWDWKTNDLEYSNIQQLAKHYEPQMLFYCYLISKKYPEQQSYVSNLVFTKAATQEIMNVQRIWTKSDIDEFEKSLSYNIYQIKNHNFSSNYIES